TISLALFLVAASPVIITAPVSIIFGNIFAISYSCLIISSTFFVSIVMSSNNGVRYTGLLYNTSLSTISIRGTCDIPATFNSDKRLIINFVVLVPTSMPALIIVSPFLDNFNYSPHPKKEKKPLRLLFHKSPNGFFAYVNLLFCIKYIKFHFLCKGLLI